MQKVMKSKQSQKIKIGFLCKLDLHSNFFIQVNIRLKEQHIQTYLQKPTFGQPIQHQLFKCSVKKGLCNSQRYKLKTKSEKSSSLLHSTDETDTEALSVVLLFKLGKVEQGKKEQQKQLKYQKNSFIKSLIYLAFLKKAELESISAFMVAVNSRYRSIL